MLQAIILPSHSAVVANGDSTPIELKDALGRVLLLTVQIEDAEEQQSFEASVFTSPDGQTWADKPTFKLPQCFYAGEYPFLLDLTNVPSANWLRVHWELNRWGRGLQSPRVTAGITVHEVPAEMLAARAAQ